MPKVTMVQHINVQITNRQRSQEWKGVTFNTQERVILNPI